MALGIITVVTQPTPALVTSRAAQRLPRLALLLLCAAYVLPGVFGRDPWRGADLNAFGLMLEMADGRTPWLAPTLGGWPADSALLPHWLGAGFIWLLSPVMDAALAARIPFALLLSATLALVWYATFHLARTEAAQPVAFAFGGEAKPVDYARALADGAVLALIASLGLLQLGHETTPELVQLSEVTLLMWAVAAAPYRAVPRWMAPATVVALGLSGAPAMACGLGLSNLLICQRSEHAPVRRLVLPLAAAVVIAAALAALVHAWRWRAVLPDDWADLLSMIRQLAWFTWPVWPMALWTLWQWRRYLQRRHIAVPLVSAAVALLAWAVMDGWDRALMLALPGLAVLAAFALPTLRRGASAAIDWFSVFFFSGAGLAAWVIYSSMQWGVPAKPLANILRLAPGFTPKFSLLALAAALLGTVAWLWLVRWRTSRNRHPLWKSLVLPASGVTLAWLLAMTLWLPVLDYARSPRPLVQQVLQHVPAGHCIRAPELPRAQVAALEVFGGYRLQAYGAALDAASPSCDVLLVQTRLPQTATAPAGWQLLARLRRPTDRYETTWLFKRNAD